ncbi:MAG: Hsp20/alpha crystallin family protein [Patescibacteria group bacterium]|jgi:HSP20 family protein
MRYISVRPWSRSGLRPLFWDEEDWPEVSTSEGINVYEEDNKVVVEAPIPGMSEDDIKVTYEDGVLRISARTEERKEDKEKGRVVHQWSKVASFDYTTYLPRPIDTKSLEANLDKGVLTVSAEVAQEAKPKEVKVKVK